MGFIISAFLLLYGLYRKKRKGTWITPDVLFCYEWALISFLASLRLFKLYEVSSETWSILLVGSLSYLAGVLFAEHYRVVVGTHPVNKKRKKEFGGDINNQWFWIIMIILYILALIELWQAIRFMMKGISLRDIRLLSVGAIEIDGFVRRTGLAYELIDNFLSAVETIFVAVAIRKFILDFRRNVKCMIAATGLVLIHAFSNGGRFGIAYMILEMLICFALYSRTLKMKGFQLSKSVKKWVRWVFLVLVVMVIVITLMRGVEVAEFLKKYYRYICGNMVFFDLHVSDLHTSGFMSYTFAGLYGFWAIVLPILHNAFGVAYPELYLKTISNVMDGQTFRTIGDGMATNAFITPFYHLFADFRILGVIVGMAFFGYIAGRAYVKMDIENEYSVVYYLVIAQMIFKTLQVYPMASKAYMMVFFVFIMRAIITKIKI